MQIRILIFDTLFKFAAFPPMKRLLVFIYATLLLGPVLHAQQSTPARPPMEPQGPRPRTGSREIEPTCTRSNSNPGSDGATEA